MTRLIITMIFAASLVFGQTSYRVHCGGEAYVDSQGNAWAADANFVGGDTFGTSQPIANTADQPLYQTERWGAATTYQFGVADGTYTVTLKFSENYFTGPNQRKFDVKVNNVVVESGLDIFAAAGGGFTALDRTYVVQATGGTGLVLQFNAVVDNPKVDAVQVVLVPPSTGSSFSDAEVPSGSGATFNLAHVPFGSSLQLFRNGLVQKTGVDFTLSGATITFTTAPSADDLLQAWYRY